MRARRVPWRCALSTLQKDTVNKRAHTLGGMLRYTGSTCPETPSGIRTEYSPPPSGPRVVM
eukprot:4991504-Pyramimonas_sp.AAC.5